MLKRRVLVFLVSSVSFICPAFLGPTPVDADASDGVPTDVAATGTITAGETFTCYLTPDAAIYCWGQAQYGQMGDASFSVTPQKVPGIISGSGSNFLSTQISAGDSHICALMVDTKVKCWGKNDYGQTGNGSTRQTGSGNPNEVHFLHGTIYPGGGPGVADDNYVKDSGGGTLSNITQISGGISTTCAIDTSKRAWCWGGNSKGQTGYGDVKTSGDYAAPSARLVRDGASSAIVGFKSIAVGELFACGLKDDGTVWCWGDNSEGQLGNGGFADSSTPIQVTSVAGVTAIAVGARHACAVISGLVKCWGQGDDGRLGSARASGGLAPVDVPGLTNVVRISAGYAHSCALDSSARLWCWGRFYDNFNPSMVGERGGAAASLRSGGVFGTSGTSSTPQMVSGFTSVKSFASGNNHVCAVEVDGPMKCWGSGTYGQLGNNQLTGYSTPQNVTANVSQTLTIDDPGTVRIANGSVTLTSSSTSGATTAFTTSTADVCTVSGAVVTIKNVGTCSINGTTPSHAVFLSANASRSFTIGASSPTADTADASAVGASGATLSGSVNARGASSVVVFELSVAASMTSPTTVSTDSVDGVTAKNVTKAVSDLKPMTKYYYRVKATNDQGAATGEIKSFTTSGSKPVAITGSATPQATKATLNGTVDPKGLATSVNFVYGTDPKLGDGTAVAASTQSGDGSKDVSVALSGLAEKTTYYYRIEATNEVGTAKGDIKSFSTTRPEGVSINNGDEFTSSQSVTVSVVGPSTAVKAILSNDGGFATSETFDLVNNAADIPWKLQSSKEGTFTKIVYVKYVSRFGSTSTPYTDDIILDTTKPVVSGATATASTSSGDAVQVARVSLKASAKGGVKLSVRGSDTISGVGSVEVRSSAAKAATKITLKSIAGKADGKARPMSQTISLKSTAKRLQVRVIDRAGNASAWRSIIVK